MCDLRYRMERLITAPQFDFRPQLFSLQLTQDSERLVELIAMGRITQIHDTLESQIEELYAARHLERNGEKAGFEDFRKKLLDGIRVDTFGTWCFYPWRNCLVHVLPEDLFEEVRTNRNQHKISKQEQRLLAEKCIAIVGLSVGSAIATTMAMEGVGGSFRLADFDTLSLSNLNRLHASIADIGFNKSILTARRMSEINPYLTIDIFAAGIRPDNIESFLQDKGKPDLIVEECDELEVKFSLRYLAKRLGIPVVMETSDRGLLDIERFDFEPDRPIFHGLVEELNITSHTTITAEQRIPIVFKILDGEALSASAQASLLEIGETISTWPQLASAVILGGGTVTDVARRILLGTLSQSGRFYIDLASIICDSNEEVLSSRFDKCSNSSAIGTSTDEAIDTLPDRSLSCEDVSQEEFRWLIRHAVLAPSGGNSQPWRFECGENRIVGFRDASRRSPLLDFDFRASDAAIGAAAENIELAARRLGLSTNWHYFPRGEESHCVFAVRLSRCEGIDEDPLFSQIGQRCTNRKQGELRTLSNTDRSELLHEASSVGAELQLISDRPAIESLGELIGKVDRLRFFSQQMHSELIQEVRWTEQEVRATRDGIDIATLELAPSERAVMELFRSWPTMARLKQVQGGGGIIRAAKLSVESSSALCLLSIPGNGRQQYVLGGRALQRVWLRATALGLSIQPVSVLVYLFSRLEDGHGSGLSSEEQIELSGVRDGFRNFFALPKEQAQILLFRLFYADRPKTRALRRDVSCVASFSLKAQPSKPEHGSKLDCENQ